MTSLYLNHLCEGPISKYDRMLRLRGSGLQYRNLGGHISAHNTSEFLRFAHRMTPIREDDREQLGAWWVEDGGLREALSRGEGEMKR